ncbi:hypothetical protein KR009_007391, partial [Drosophila setifemur]
TMAPPRNSRWKAEKKKLAEDAVVCVSDVEKTQALDHLPRHKDTFWHTDSSVSRCKLTGQFLLTNELDNKGLTFTHEERQLYSINGLLPMATRTIDEQVAICQRHIENVQGEMQLYLYMNYLGKTYRRLFYRLLMSNPRKYMPMVQASVTVGNLKNHSLLYTYGQGLFVNIKDLGHIHQILANWPSRNIRCLMVSNGARVLSLGDLGVDGLPLLVSKMHEIVVYGGMDPNHFLPVMLDVGTDNDKLRQNPIYTGLKERRAAPALYDQFFEEFTLAVLRQYGCHVLILCKDFESKLAKKQLELYRDRQCIMNVNFQCLAASALSGVVACNRMNRVPFSTNMFMFCGVDSLTIGMARLAIAFLKRLGLHEVAARKQIWFCDEFGLIVIDRANIPEELLEFAHPHRNCTLVEAIDATKPNVLVGASTHPNSFTPDVLKAMERSAEQPIIFAMSEPVCQAECTAEAAFAYTKGRCIFISGSPLPPLKYGNKWYQPGHCTSINILAGLSMGIILAGYNTVPDEVFCVAAERLASLVWPCDLAMKNVFPPLRKLECISLQVTEAVFTYAFRRGLATLWPMPVNPMEYIKKSIYDFSYRSNVADIYCMQTRRIETTESEKFYKLNI